MVEIIPVGTLVELNTDVVNDGHVYSTGTKAEINYYISAEEDDEGKAFYWLVFPGSRHDNEFWAYPDEITILQTAEEWKASRRIPTLAEATRFIADHLGDIGGMGEVDESYGDPDDGTVEFAGTTEHGVAFVFSVRIEGPYDAHY